MAYITLIGFILAIFIGTSLYKTYINPVTIFIGIFCLGGFTLFSSDFFYTSLISSTVWYMYIASFVCFFLGILLRRGIPLRIKRQPTETDDEELEKEIYQKEIRALFVVTLLATIITWSQRISTIGLSSFLMTLLTTKEAEKIRGLPTFILYVKMITIFLSPFVVNYIIRYKDRRPIYFIIIAFTFAANISYNRNVLFYILLLDLFVFIYSRSKTSVKFSFKWAAYIVVIVLTFRFFAYTQSLLNKEFNIQGTFLGNQISGSMITVISYFAGPLVSTGIYMDRLASAPFWGYTFRSVLSILNGFGIIRMDTNTYMPTEFVYIPFKFNTTTIQLYIIKEGGWLWLMVFFIILGYAADRLFWDYRNSRSRYCMMGLALVSLLLITSIRSYIFTRLDMFLYFITLIVLLIARRVKIHRR